MRNDLVHLLASLLLAFVLVLALPVGVLGYQAKRNRASEQSAEVYVPFKWNQGDVRRYRVTNATSSEKDNTITRKSEAYSDIEIEVVEKNQGGTIVTWKMGKASLANGDSGADQITEKINDIFGGLKLRIEIDNDGVYRGINNWPEVAVAVKKLMTLTKELVDDIDMPKQQKQAVWDAAMKRHGTRQAIEARITEPLQLLLQNTNCNFKQHAVAKNETTVPYLGRPLPATEQYSVANLDLDKQLVTIAWSRSIDKEKSQPIAEQAVIEMAKELNKPTLPEAGFLKGFSITSNANYEIDLATGWPRKIVFVNKAGQGSALNVRKITIERR